MASHIFGSALQIILLIVEKYFPAGRAAGRARAWLLRRRSASCNLGGGQSSGSGSGEAPTASLAGNNTLNQTRAPRQSQSQRKGKVLFYASTKFFSKCWHSFLWRNFNFCHILCDIICKDSAKVIIMGDFLQSVTFYKLDNWQIDKKYTLTEWSGTIESLVNIGVTLESLG